jgi:hypothetical protein
VSGTKFGFCGWRAAAKGRTFDYGFKARPTGVGRAITTYSMPIEGRDERLVAARRLA